MGWEIAMYTRRGNHEKEQLDHRGVGAGRFEPPLSPPGTPTRILNNNTIRSSVPTPVLSDPFPGTPAAVCALFVGSTLDSVGYISADEKAFDAVSTHSAGCS